MKKLPAGLPPLPKGAVYLGKAGQFKPLPFYSLFKGWCIFPKGNEWFKSLNGFMGDSKGYRYAAPAGSRVVRLNAPALPRPQTRRAEIATAIQVAHREKRTAHETAVIISRIIDKHAKRAKRRAAK